MTSAEEWLSIDASESSLSSIQNESYSGSLGRPESEKEYKKDQMMLKINQIINNNSNNSNNEQKSNDELIESKLSHRSASYDYNQSLLNIEKGQIQIINRSLSSSEIPIKPNKFTNNNQLNQNNNLIDINSNFKIEQKSDELSKYNQSLLNIEKNQIQIISKPILQKTNSYPLKREPNIKSTLNPNARSYVSENDRKERSPSIPNSFHEKKTSTLHRSKSYDNNWRGKSKWTTTNVAASDYYEDSAHNKTEDDRQQFLNDVNDINVLNAQKSRPERESYKASIPMFINEEEEQHEFEDVEEDYEQDEENEEEEKELELKIDEETLTEEEKYKRLPVRVYLEKTKVVNAMTVALQRCADARPKDPVQYL